MKAPYTPLFQSGADKLSELCARKRVESSGARRFNQVDRGRHHIMNSEHITLDLRNDPRRREIQVGGKPGIFRTLDLRRRKTAPHIPGGERH